MSGANVGTVGHVDHGALDYDTYAMMEALAVAYQFRKFGVVPSIQVAIGNEVVHASHDVMKLKEASYEALMLFVGVDIKWPEEMESAVIEH